jgi:hypothetical protein
MHDDGEPARQMRRMRTIGPAETPWPLALDAAREALGGDVGRIPLGFPVGKIIDAADIDGLLEAERRIVATSSQFSGSTSIVVSPRDSISDAIFWPSLASRSWANALAVMT